jgi:hypothetical protein
MSVARCQREVTAREFAEWVAFYALEAEESNPERELTDDERNAKFAAVLGGLRQRPGQTVMERR